MYAQFLHRLHSLDLIEFTLEAPTETVGLFFFAKKKQGKLRLSMGCRRSNAWFHEPEKVSLATGDALGRLRRFLKGVSCTWPAQTSPMLFTPWSCQLAEDNTLGLRFAVYLCKAIDADKQ